jgi:threonine/homoserine/homoserine lactone efflux protein
MLAGDTAATFFGLSLLLGFTPGPDNLFVVVQAAVHGRRAGLVVVLGLCTGLLVHTGVVALGIAAMFAASAGAFTALKVLGAAYLAWLAWQAWWAPGEAHAAASQARALTAWALFARGVVMNLTNPKVVLFFLALLPQFVDPHRGAIAWQLATLGLVFIGATLLAFGVITWLADLLGPLLRSSASARRTMNRAAALVFAGLALRLATTQR